MLPAMVCRPTCVEILHCLLDLPSLAAAMTQTHGQTIAQFAERSSHPLTAALYNYILRPEVRVRVRELQWQRTKLHTCFSGRPGRHH